MAVAMFRGDDDDGSVASHEGCADQFCEGVDEKGIFLVETNRVGAERGIQARTGFEARGSAAGPLLALMVQPLQNRPKHGKLHQNEKAEPRTVNIRYQKYTSYLLRCGVYLKGSTDVRKIVVTDVVCE